MFLIVCLLFSVLHIFGQLPYLFRVTTRPFFLCSRHPFQVALSPLNISNTLWSLHLQPASSQHLLAQYHHTHLLPLLQLYLVASFVPLQIINLLNFFSSSCGMEFGRGKSATFPQKRPENFHLEMIAFHCLISISKSQGFLPCLRWPLEVFLGWYNTWSRRNSRGHGRHGRHSGHEGWPQAKIGHLWDGHRARHVWHVHRVPRAWGSAGVRGLPRHVPGLLRVLTTSNDSWK